MDVPAGRKKRTIKKRCRSGIYVEDIQLADLLQVLHLPSGKAARALGLGITVFKKICRRRGLAYWPYKKNALEAHTTRSMEENSSSGEVCRQACRVSPHSSATPLSSPYPPPSPLWQQGLEAGPAAVPVHPDSPSAAAGGEEGEGEHGDECGGLDLLLSAAAAETAAEAEAGAGAGWEGGQGEARPLQPAQEPTRSRAMPRAWGAAEPAAASGEPGPQPRGLQRLAQLLLSNPQLAQHLQATMAALASQHAEQGVGAMRTVVFEHSAADASPMDTPFAAFASSRSAAPQPQHGAAWARPPGAAGAVGAAGVHTLRSAESLRSAGSAFMPYAPPQPSGPAAALRLALEQGLAPQQSASAAQPLPPTPVGRLPPAPAAAGRYGCHQRAPSAHDFLGLPYPVPLRPRPHRPAPLAPARSPFAHPLAAASPWGTPRSGSLPEAASATLPPLASTTLMPSAAPSPEHPTAATAIAAAQPAQPLPPQQAQRGSTPAPAPCAELPLPNKLARSVARYEQLLHLRQLLWAQAQARDDEQQGQQVEVAQQQQTQLHPAAASAAQARWWSALPDQARSAC